MTKREAAVNVPEYLAKYLPELEDARTSDFDSYEQPGYTKAQRLIYVFWYKGLFDGEQATACVKLKGYKSRVDKTPEKHIRIQMNTKTRTIVIRIDTDGVI